MANASKAKGYRGEVEVLTLLQGVVNEVFAEKGLAPPELSRAPHGRDIVGLPWLAPEVKRVEGDNPALVKSFWEQCKDQAKRTSPLSPKEKEPVLFHRMNNRPWRVRMFGYLDLPKMAPVCPSCEGKGKRPMKCFAAGSTFQETTCGDCKGVGSLPAPPAKTVRCPVDISLEAFLAYLRIRIRQELDLPTSL